MKDLISSSGKDVRTAATGSSNSNEYLTTPNIVHTATFITCSQLSLALSSS